MKIGQINFNWYPQPLKVKSFFFQSATEIIAGSLPGQLLINWNKGWSSIILTFHIKKPKRKENVLLLPFNRR